MKGNNQILQIWYVDPKDCLKSATLACVRCSGFESAFQGRPMPQGQLCQLVESQWFWEPWCVGWWLSHISCYFFSYSSGLPSTNLWRPVLQSSADAFFWASFSMMAESIVGFKMVQVTLPLRTKTHPFSYSDSAVLFLWLVATPKHRGSSHKTRKFLKQTKNPTTSNQNVQAVKLSFLCLCHSHASFTVAANAFRISLRGTRQNTLTCDTGNQVLQTPEFSDWTVGTLWVLYWCVFCRRLYIYHTWNSFAIIICTVSLFSIYFA